MQKMQTVLFWGSLLCLIVGLVLTWSIWPFGLLFLGIGFVLLALR